MTPKHLKNIFIGIISALCLFGIYMRFYHITHNDFIYYDEGYYLNFNRYFYDMLVANYPDNFADFKDALWFWMRLSLGTGKALWFMMSDMRVFFGMYKAWYFPRVLAAIAGCLTFGMIFLFAKRFYGSRRVGLLSMALLAILPAHVFYSRLAMQESFSTLCFLSGFYFYAFPRRFNWRIFLAGACFAGAWFTNYRLITLPVHLALCEMLLYVSESGLPDIRQWPKKCVAYFKKFAGQPVPRKLLELYRDFRQTKGIGLRRYVWTVVTFFAFIFLIGDIDNGQNTEIVFAWIFYQSNLAKEQFDLFNFLSFPYYLFRLENTFYGLLFFGNIYYVVRKKWKKLLPFALAVLYMFIYSFSAEKGARYLMVVMPFITMAVASLLVSIFDEFPKKAFRIGVCVVAVLLVAGLLSKSFKLYRSRSDYRTVMEDLMAEDKDVKLIATQNFVLNLFPENRKNVVTFPYKFRKFMQLNAAGYRYLLVCPQAYVSWAEDMKRFRPELVGFLNFIVRSVKPVKVYDHFNDVVLERYVLDHNENLRRSLAFLKDSKEKKYGTLRVYDTGHVLALVDRLVGLKSIRLNPEYKTFRPSDMLGR